MFFFVFVINKSLYFVFMLLRWRLACNDILRYVWIDDEFCT